MVRARRHQWTAYLRHLPTAVGVGLVATAIALVTSPVAAGLLFGAVALMLGISFTLGLIRRRKLRGQRPAEELARWQAFVQMRRRWAPWESGFYLYIAGVFAWLNGVSLAAVLFAVGMGLFLVHRWLIEPRLWAEETDRKLARVESAEPGSAT